MIQVRAELKCFYFYCAMDILLMEIIVSSYRWNLRNSEIHESSGNIFCLSVHFGMNEWKEKNVQSVST